ncbi:SCO6745 family protein [Amycolatopsis pittospori]|uniref:SCO6745 family protein n=1 Tax=Amycolatopsis pittospori TaxID=2749434 RepID=UPI0015F0CB4F|nr:hypothetical protein [Amycolatopsis pittospori]
MDDEAMGPAREIRGPVQVLGGRFMTSPELAEVEAEVGLAPRALYFRGRSAVLGDPPPKVVAELFGIFPHWLFEAALPPAMETLDAVSAVRAYSRSSARWGRVSLSDADDPGRLAGLLFRLVDAADASGLALFAGWQLAERPDDDVERLAFALMVFREFRGGVHFAALRAVGLTVPEAVVADPEGGRGRLLRTAWSEEAAGELIAAAEAKGDLRQRWRRAEHLTDQRVAELLAVTLTDAERDGLRRRLGALAAAPALLS